MIKTVLLVPVRDNDGKAFTRAFWRPLEQRLRSFGGFTRSSVQGEWEAQGRIYHDRSRRYEVSLTSWTQLPDWLNIASWVLEHFRQEALYIEVAGIPEILSANLNRYP